MCSRVQQNPKKNKRPEFRLLVTVGHHSNTTYTHFHLNCRNSFRENPKQQYNFGVREPFVQQSLEPFQRFRDDRQTTDRLTYIQTVTQTCFQKYVFRFFWGSCNVEIH